VGITNPDEIGTNGCWVRSEYIRPLRLHFSAKVTVLNI
jgi:hypothetical protein